MDKHKRAEALGPAMRAPRVHYKVISYFCMWCEVWIEVHFLFFWYLDLLNTIVLGLFIIKNYTMICQNFIGRSLFTVVTKYQYLDIEGGSDLHFLFSCVLIYFV